MGGIRESRGARATLAALMVWALVALMPMSAAHACSCIGYDFDEAVEAADLIAEITVEGEIGETDDGTPIYAVLVDRVWKGDSNRRIRFATHDQTTACGLGRLMVGDTFVTWASAAVTTSDQPGPAPFDFSSSWCALPMDGGGEDELTAALGEPDDRTDEVVPAIDPPVTADPSDPPAAIDPNEGEEPEGGTNLLVIAVGIGVVTAAVALILIIGTGIAVLAHTKRRRR